MDLHDVGVHDVFEQTGFLQSNRLVNVEQIDTLADAVFRKDAMPDDMQLRYRTSRSDDRTW